jgi:hypothetical protein
VRELGVPLTTRKSRERGCGPSCAAVVTAAAKEAILHEERINAEAYLQEKRPPATREAYLQEKRPPATRHRRAAKGMLDARGFTTTRLAAAPEPSSQRLTRKPKKGLRTSRPRSWHICSGPPASLYRQRDDRARGACRDPATNALSDTSRDATRPRDPIDADDHFRD